MKVRRKSARHHWGGCLRKAIVMLLLTVVSGSATAAWVLVGKTEISTLYAEPSMPQQGDVVKMWNLSDFNVSHIFNATSGGPTYSSLIRQEEFNCKEERMRTLYLEFNTRNMGGGNVVYSNSTRSGWTQVGPAPEDSASRSTGRLFFELACRKR